MRTAAGEAGLAFDPPRRIPYARPALEAAEWTRLNRPDAFEPFHRALFEAHWVRGLALDDLDVLASLAEGTGIAPGEIRRAVSERAAREHVDRSTDAAHSLGVSGTPAFFIAGRFVLPGAQPYEVFDRVIERLRALPPEDV